MAWVANVLHQIDTQETISVIKRLTGTLLECDLTSAVIDVNGVGYGASVPLSTYERLPSPGESVSLYTHLHVREDALQLFAFGTTQERSLFQLLITVSGVGPRLALNVLSCMSVTKFCGTILDNDLKALTLINGIGKRSAERLVIELREKVQSICPEAALTSDDRQVETSREATDAVAALETLGFRNEAARKTVKKLCSEAAPEHPSAESLIRKALTILNS